MQLTIKKGRESSIYFNNKFYDTGVPLDLEFSEAMRLTRVIDVDAKYGHYDYDPKTWQKDHMINFMGDIDMVSGFGGVSYNLIKYSEPEVKSALLGRLNGVKDQTIFRAQNRELNPNAAMIWHDQPREQWLYSPFGKNIAIVPFETTVIPRSWIGKINTLDALMVPCEQNIEAFRNSGVKIPIELIHWGVDKNKFYPVERDENKDIFTFGTMGMLTERKGTDILLEAFKEAFPRERDVRLICKTSAPYWKFGKVDPRVSIQIGHYDHQELMNDFFKEVDTFVFPTRGEGFGLTPLEAMATGIPAIVTDWAGPKEYMTPETGWALDYKMTPATVFTKDVYKEECGDWAEPSKEHLIELMRHAYTHRNEAHKKGKAAAKYVQDNWLWEDKIGMYLNALHTFLD